MLLNVKLCGEERGKAGIAAKRAETQTQIMLKSIEMVVLPIFLSEEMLYSYNHFDNLRLRDRNLFPFQISVAMAFLQ